MLKFMSEIKASHKQYSTKWEDGQSNVSIIPNLLTCAVELDTRHELLQFDRSPN